MKTYEEVRERLVRFAENSSEASNDLARLIENEAIFFIKKNSSSSSAKIGYTEFYRDEVERLTTIKLRDVEGRKKE